ncbi:hypothetical protein OsI_37019 [Oryza sativa Indica Group]|uniref:Uncharacterized protein n=1 Tax=Oryza sativa subsp. indica TaxID=39946 RepID=A2ZGW9_ORYSI|nr:hypothetical protein OsI_37019 [Oryza sativa Indica Group]
MPYCPFHHRQDRSHGTFADDGTLEAQDHMVGYIDMDPLGPYVLHNLDDQESSGSNSLHDVIMIEGVVEDVCDEVEEGEIRLMGDPVDPVDPVRTLAEHLTTFSSLLRHALFDPVTRREADAWLKWIESTVANLNSAFAAAAGPPSQDPPRNNEVSVVEDYIPGPHPSDDERRHPRNASPRRSTRQTPPHPDACDLRNQLTVNQLTVVI